MTTIQVTEATSLEDILRTAEQLNMTSVETLDLLWGAIDIVKGKNKRVFAYSDPVASAQPVACRADFVRSFVHTDWIDGESVVQAGETTMEEGFNARFHKIEDDLDALAADIARAFVCMGDQRAEVSKALDEVKAELNRINSDIHDCCQADSGTLTPWEPPFVYPYPYPEPEPRPWPGRPPWSGPRPGGPWTGPYGPEGPLGPWIDPDVIHRPPGWGTTMPWGGDLVDPVRSYLDSVEGAQTYGTAADLIVRSNSDPSRGIVAGMSARLIEETVFNGQPVEVWSTAAGLILTPRAEAAPVAAGRAGWTNPRVDATSRFARWAATNEKAVRERLGERFTLGDFAKAFGEEKVTGGIRIAAVVDRLSSDLKGTSPLDFVAPLAETNARAIMREGVASETVIGGVGLNPGGKEGVAAAAVGAMKSLSADVAAALPRAGIRTVGALAKMSAADIVGRLRAADVEIGVDAAAAMNAEAAALVEVDRIARGGGGRG